MTTRKHFIKVAQTVSELPTFADRRAKAKGWADFFSADNPRFDRFRFFAACNAVSEGEPVIAKAKGGE